MSSTVNLSSKVEKERQKSTLLAVTAPNGIEKPWLEMKDPFARIAYFVTYGAILLGVAAGALRCWAGWSDIDMVKGNLCMVLEENFERGEEGVFGENGKFFREVDMSGFGCVILSSSLFCITSVR